MGLIIPEKRRVGMLDDAPGGESRRRGMLVREEDDVWSDWAPPDRDVPASVEEGSGGARAQDQSQKTGWRALEAMQDDALDDESILELVADLIPELGDEGGVIIVEETELPSGGAGSESSSHSDRDGLSEHVLAAIRGLTSPIWGPFKAVYDMGSAVVGGDPDQSLGERLSALPSMPLNPIDLPALVICYESYKKFGAADAALEMVRQNTLRTPIVGHIAGTTEHVIQYGWTPEATEGASSLIAVVVIVPVALGRIRAYRIFVTKKLLEKMADSAERNVGGRGGTPGTLKHSYVRQVLERYQRRYGKIGKGLEPEASYKGGKRANYGQRGSIRTDYVEGNPRSPNAVYELKFGDARLGPARVVRITRETGLTRKFIIEIKPRR